MFHKPSKRKYQKKLSTVFFVIGILFSVVLFSFFSYTYKYNKKNILLSLETTASINNELSRLTITNIARIIATLNTSSYLRDWATSTTDSEYLFSAIQLKKQLQKESTLLNTPSFTLALWPNPNASYSDYITTHVLTSSALIEKETYFEQSSISSEDLEEICLQLAVDPYVLYPQYDEANQLYQLLFIKSDNNLPILYVATIPVHSLVDLSNSFAYLIINGDHIISSDKEFEYYDLIENVSNKINIMTTSFHYKNYMGITSEYVFPNTKIVYLFPDYIAGSFYILLLCVILLFIILIGLNFTANSLYSPIDAFIKDAAKSDSALSVTDEFLLLREQNKRLETLSNTLQDLEAHNNNLMIQKSYREILLSNEKSDFCIRQFPDNHSQYTIVRFLFTNLEKLNSYAELQILKNNFYEASLYSDHIIFIDMSSSSFLLLLQDVKSEDISNYLSEYTKKTNDFLKITEIEYKIAVSNTIQGIDQLHSAYIQTLSIFNYKNMFVNNTIIYYSQIADLDTYYTSYSLETENKLIYYTINGSEKALEIFSDIIRENIQNRSLSEENIQSLIYSLIGTILRIFQELRSEPTQFLGHSINYGEWYNNWNSSTTVSQIRQTLLDIVSTVTKNTNSTNNCMLNKMQQYIFDNYNDDIMLNDIAEYLNLTPKYCSTLFKKLSNYNFKEYLNQYRIEKAQEFLKENPDMRISDLAILVGFNSSNSFIRVFDKYTGITPAQFASKFKDV